MRLSPRYEGPPLITIDGPIDDQRAPLMRQRLRMQELLEGLTDEQWTTPSRCEGWTVQDVVAHLASVNGFWAHSIRQGLAGEPTRILAAFDPVAVPEAIVAGTRGESNVETLAKFAQSNYDLLDVVASLKGDDWNAIAESPPGHVTVRTRAFHALWDSWVHERDIALPLGLDVVDEPDEVASCLRYAAAIGPALAMQMGAQMRGVYKVAATDPACEIQVELNGFVLVSSGVDTPAAPTLAGAALDLIDQLSIRAPLPADAPREWRELSAGLAVAFDQVVG